MTVTFPFRSALVTGASSGIGELMAGMLADAGVSTVAVARRADRLASLAKSHPGVEVLVADLSTDVGQAAVVDRITDDERAVELVVNNAGFGTSGRFHELDPDRLADEIEVNIAAVTRLSHAALSVMLPRGRGAARLRCMLRRPWLLPALLGCSLAAQVPLRDLPALARARADRLRPAQEQALEPYWADLSLDYRDNATFLDQQIAKVVALGDSIVPLLLEKLQPAAGGPAARHLAANCRRALEIMQRVRKRALVIVLSNLRDEDDDTLLPALEVLRRRHLVLFASLRERILTEALSAPVKDFDGALAHAAAADYLRDRFASFRRLERCGAQLLDVEPQELPLALVNRYLDIKRSGIL